MEETHTPIVDDQETLRAYAETIRARDAEIARLKALLAEAAKKFERVMWAYDFVHESTWEAHEIPDLIFELRKAAQ